MATKPVIDFKKLNRQHLLLGILIVVGIAALVYWKNSSNPPEALFSSANEQRPHWPHADVPFKNRLVIHTSRGWDSTLKFVLGSWEKPSLIFFSQVRGKEKEPCQIIPETMNICSYNDTSPITAFSWFMSDSNGHILGSVTGMNDYYYNSRLPGPYNTEAWRNTVLCYMVGFTVGAPPRYGDDPMTAKSCMVGNWGPDTINNTQAPDQTDYDNLKELYTGHNDDPNSSSSVSFKIGQMNQLVKQREFGSPMGTSADGLTELYKTDLGDGYYALARVMKAPASATPMK